MQTENAVVYARLEHGGWPVEVTPFGYVLNRGKPERHSSVRSLLMALCGRDPHAGFERYFRMPVRSSGGLSTLDLFGSGSVLHPVLPVLQKPRRKSFRQTRRGAAETPESFRQTRRAPDTLKMFEASLTIDAELPFIKPFPREALGLTVAPEVMLEGLSGTLESNGLVDDGSVLLPEHSGSGSELALKTGMSDSAMPERLDLITSTGAGIDLAKRGHEVRKLLFAGFGRKILVAGYDPDDVLQEVYRGLLARNVGTCRFDVSKSSFGHYVHMVAGCVLANYHRHEQRIAEHEVLGAQAPSDDGGMESVDASTVASCADTTEDTVGELHAVRSLTAYVLLNVTDARVAASLVQIIPLMQAGHGRSEIAEKLNVTPSAAGKLLATLRELAADWAQTA